MNNASGSMTFAILMFIAIIVILVIIAIGLIIYIFALKKNVPNNQSIQQEAIPETVPVAPPTNIKQFERRFLLTKNEYQFFCKLKPIAQKYNMHILCKIRVADIIQPISTGNRSDWYSRFGHIKSRHVDFALANPENMYVLLAIELDDSSHKQEKTKERDEYINKAYSDANVKLLRTYNCTAEELESKITSILEIANRVNDCKPVI